MTAGIVVGDMRQARVKVGRGGSERDLAARIAGGEEIAQRAPAPGAAEIEAVEVDDLAVGAVADRGRPEQRCRLARREPRQKDVAATR